MKNSFYIKQTTSTNIFLRDLMNNKSLTEGFVVYTDFQLSGKGQSGNSWESEPKKNLLFSILLYPHHIDIEEQFIISQIVSNAIWNVLSDYCKEVKIKWPNDIYVNDGKIAGILIENSLCGQTINNTMIGIGLNVNQTDFKSDAPNPVSLRQINKKSFRRKTIMQKIVDNILTIYNEMDYAQIREDYFNNLYRKDGFYAFRAGNDVFNAQIKAVLPDGRIYMETDDGTTKSFYFKQVEFII
ncbi:MAG: biotin--[acetyl-CoA-carboxylase] ligase [Paludibacter sp.]|nr:biotin--[acetyl-CoA-carboxylase] ligase [Paludibacter sp.]